MIKLKALTAAEGTSASQGVLTHPVTHAKTFFNQDIKEYIETICMCSDRNDLTI